MSNQTIQMMKALVFCGAGEPKWEGKAKPAIQAASDAIVRVAKTTICGTDLHILKGHVPSVTPGRILRHEGVGVVEQIGKGVTNFCIGDRVLISCITSFGIAVLMTAQFYSPSEMIVIDIDDNRLAIARELNATQTINNSDGNAIAAVMKLTLGVGVDVAIEAIGATSTFDICQGIVAAGGHIANVGVHGTPVQFNLDKLWSHNITLTTGLVDTSSTSMLLKAVTSKKLEPSQLITRRFQSNQMLQAYNTFTNAMQEKAMKVIISNDS